VLERVARHHEDAGFFGRFEKLLAFRDAGRERLLDENVTAACNRLQRKRQVTRRRRRNDDHICFQEHVVEIARAFQAVVARRGRKPTRIAVYDLHRHVRHSSQNARVFRTPISIADDGHAHCSAAHPMISRIPRREAVTPAVSASL
jgi:hypothetical protein